MGFIDLLLKTKTGVGALLFGIAFFVGLELPTEWTAEPAWLISSAKFVMSAATTIFGVGLRGALQAVTDATTKAP